MPGSTRGILAEKLNQLDVASKDWKKRVGPKDAVEFSVAGRMGVDATSVTTPILPPAREKKTPKPARFKSKKGNKFNFFKSKIYKLKFSSLFYYTMYK